MMMLYQFTAVKAENEVQCDLIDDLQPPGIHILLPVLPIQERDRLGVDRPALPVLPVENIGTTEPFRIAVIIQYPPNALRIAICTSELLLLYTNRRFSVLYLIS